MKKPSLDPNKLLKDARTAAVGSHRIRTGTTAQLREHLEVINTLRAEGVSFAAIASALAAQGVMQGKGENEKPITASRLTALYSQMKRVDAERARKRQAREDTIKPPAETKLTAPRKNRLSLAAELDVQPLADTGSPEPDEELIRRDNLKRSQRFVKKRQE